MKKQLLEEEFFVWYNYGTPPWDTKKLQIFDRKWFIDRYVEQKNKESEAQQRAIKKSKH